MCILIDRGGGEAGLWQSQARERRAAGRRGCEEAGGVGGELGPSEGEEKNRNRIFGDVVVRK